MTNLVGTIPFGGTSEIPIVDSELLSKLKSLARFCIEHPFLGLLVIFVVLVAWGSGKILEKVRQTVTKWLARVLRGHDLAAVVIIFVIIVGGIGFAIERSVIALFRPRPIFLESQSQIVGPEYTLRWTYDAPALKGRESEQGKDYTVTVRDLDSGKQLSQKQTSEKSYRIFEQGKIEVTVETFDGAEATTRIEHFSSSLERIKRTGKLRVGIHTDDIDSDITDTVFCYEASGKYSGFDISLMELLADELTPKLKAIDKDFTGPVRAEYHYFGWPDVIYAPNTFDVDLAIASISITKARKEKVRFSKPYYTTEMALIQPRKAGISERFKRDDLKDLTVGVHVGTTEAEFLASLPAPKDSPYRPVEVVPADNNRFLIDMLLQNRVDGLLYDYARSLPYVNHQSQRYMARMYERETGETPETYGMTFCFGNAEFVQRVNEILEAKKEGIAKLMKDHLERVQSPRLGGDSKRK